MSNHKNTTNSILFLSIPPELEAILHESIDDEIARQPILFGTVISYLNEYIAADVYNYIKTRLGSNNSIMGLILPNFGDENRQNQNSQAAEDMSSKFVRDYYTEDYGRNLRANSYGSSTSSKNYNTTPVVHTFPHHYREGCSRNLQANIYGSSRRSCNTSGVAHSYQPPIPLMDIHTVPPANFVSTFDDDWRNNTSERGYHRRQARKMTNRQLIRASPYTTGPNSHTGSPARPVYGSETLRELRRRTANTGTSQRPRLRGDNDLSRLYD